MKKEYIEIDSKFYQEIDIIILPTDNPNPKVALFKNIKDWKGNDIYNAKLEFTDNSTFIANMVLFNKGKASSNSQSESQFYNLYYISDEEIKEGDWVLRGNGSYGCRKVLRIHKDFAICTDFWDKPIETSFPLNELKKIIATTDKELNIHWNKQDYKALPRPSNEFLRKFCKLGGIEKVLVEYVDNGYEVDMEGRGGMDEGETCWMSKMELKVASDNTIVCKPVSKSHSELWDDVFRVLWNRDVSEGTREAMIREKYSIFLKKL